MSRVFLARTGVIMLAVVLLSACERQETSGDTRDVAGEDPVQSLESTEQFATGDGLIANRENLPGAALFADNCASCHLGAVPKAPHLQWLEMMPPGAIFNALTTGVMADQGKHLDQQDKLGIVEYITRQSMAAGLPVLSYAPQCAADKQDFDRTRNIPQVGWGHDTRRFIPESIGGMTASTIGDIELKWAYGFPNATRARSQPTIAMGAVFVGGEDGRVMALDLETGCEKWAFAASAEVRTTIVVADDDAPKAFFGDLLGKIYALDALTGELLWSVRADDHPSATITGTMQYVAGKILAPVSSLEVIPAADPSYPCCTFRGSVVALSTIDGEELWRFYPIPDAPELQGQTSAGANIFAPSGAPVWTNPTLDIKRNVAYVGSGENYSSPADGNSDAIFAIDLDTGRRVWQRQTISGDAWNVACMMKNNPNCPAENGPDFDHSSSVLLVDLPDGKQVLVAGHKNGNVYGLDPDNQGALLWATKVGRGSIQGGVHFGMAADGATVYVPINDMNNTRNGDVLDPEQARPGMHMLDARSGKLVWSALQENVCDDQRPFCDPGISAAVTAIPGAVIAGHLDGHIRVYDQSAGQVLWDFNSALYFDTVNAVRARGGGMSGSGAAVGEGYLAINSGYGLYFHEAGNILLMFGQGQSAD